MDARIRNRWLVAVGGVAAVAAVGSVIWTLPAATASDIGRAGDHLGVLARPQPDADRIPDLVVDKIRNKVLPETARFVADDSGRRSWVAVDASGQICLITSLPGQALITGVTCAPPAEFAKRGLGLQVVGPEAASEGYLVPDGFVTESGKAVEGYWVATAPNWFVSSAHAASVDPLRLNGPGGATLMLEDLAPPQD